MGNILGIDQNNRDQLAEQLEQIAQNVSGLVRSIGEIITPDTGFEDLIKEIQRSFMSQPGFDHQTSLSIAEILAKEIWEERKLVNEG